MGSACTQTNVMLFLAAMEKCLLDQGVNFNQGVGIQAAAKAGRTDGVSLMD